jgi:hypothetical protein
MERKEGHRGDRGPWRGQRTLEVTECRKVDRGQNVVKGTEAI